MPPDVDPDILDAVQTVYTTDLGLPGEWDRRSANGIHRRRGRQDHLGWHAPKQQPWAAAAFETGLAATAANTRTHQHKPR